MDWTGWTEWDETTMPGKMTDGTGRDILYRLVLSVIPANLLTCDHVLVLIVCQNQPTQISTGTCARFLRKKTLRFWSLAGFSPGHSDVTG